MKTYNRINSLDSIRGISALTVVISHYIQALNEMNLSTHRSFIELIYRILTLLFIWSGHAAVIIFFVLSGYVLSLMLQRGRSSYHIYVIKRWVRLYIPYIFSIFLSLFIIICANIQHKTSLGLFFSNKWNGLPQSKDILSSLFFLLPFNTNRINFVVWSLIYEIRISLLFPIILFLVNRIKNHYFIFVFTVMSIIFLLIHSLLTPNSNQYSGEIFMTGYYIAPFAAGAYIFRYEKQIKTWLLNQNRIRINILFALSIIFLIFGSPVINSLISFMLNYANNINDLGDLIITIGAFTLIVISTYLSAPSKILNNPIFSYLGRISYSLYLTHSIILLLLFHTVYNKLPLITFIIIASILTIFVSDITYRFIEMPAIKLSRKFSVNQISEQKT